jgi:hypothetical protein
MRNEGPDGVNTAIGNLNIGGYYEVLATLQPTRDTKRPMLLKAKSHCIEVRFKYLRYVIYLETIFICCFYSLVLHSFNRIATPIPMAYSFIYIYVYIGC